MALDHKNYNPDLMAGAGETVSGALSVGGALTSTGVFTASSTSAHTGASTFASTINVTGASTLTGNVSSVGVTTVKSAATVPATAGAVAAGIPLQFFSNGPAFYVTSDVPTHTAVKGSVCINTGGTTTNNRMYINTDGATTWTAVTTAA